MEIFEAAPALLFIGIGILGLLVGSLLNVVVYRVPIMMEMAWREQLEEMVDEPFSMPPHLQGEKNAFNLWWPPSACTRCGQRIGALQNVPILSYLLLRGRCAGCGAAISRRYPIVEAFVGLTSLVVAWTFGPTWTALAALLFTWMLIAMSLIDFDRQWLPDSLTLPLLWAGLVIALVEVDGAPLFTDLRSSVIGAVAGYLSLWLVFHGFKLLTGKEGMGYGDFKLLAAIGAWLGWQMLPLVILLSAAVGSVVGIGLIVFLGRSRQLPIPFGPFLAAAGWIAMLCGDDIVTLYSQWALQ